MYANLWKNYYTTIVNVVFFLGFAIDRYFDPTSPYEGFDYNCKEDRLVDDIIKLFVSEIVLRFAYYVYWNIHLKIKHFYDPSFNWRTEFMLEDEFVWINVINLELWISMIVYPVMAWVCVVFIWLQARYLIYRLTKQKVQPLKASNDMSVGSLMLMYNTWTFIVVFAFFSSILFIKTPRFVFWSLETNTFDASMHCGPWLSNNMLSPTEEVQFFPDHATLLSRILLSVVAQLFLLLIPYMVGKSS